MNQILKLIKKRAQRETYRDLSIVEFIEQERVLTGSESVVSGGYRMHRTEYLREPLLACAQDGVNIVSTLKGVQIGATVGLLENCILYYAKYKIPTPIGLYMSTGAQMERRISNIQAMFTESDLRGLMGISKSKGSSLEKILFKGGSHLHMMGISSSTARSAPFKVVLQDEISATGWLPKANDDGDLLKLSSDRTTSYRKTGDYKIIRVSTPGEVNNCLITESFKQGSQERLTYTCECGHRFWFDFYLLKYKEDISDVHLECPGCKKKYYEFDKQQMIKDSKWIPDNPNVKDHRSFHLPSTLSSWTSWNHLIKEYHECYDVKSRVVLDDEKYRTFVNNVLALPYEENKDLELTKSDIENAKHPQVVTGYTPKLHPISGAEVAYICNAVDFNLKDASACKIAVYTDSRIIVCDYQVIPLSIDEIHDREMENLINYLRKPIKTKGHSIKPLLTCLDTGYQTETVLKLCKYLNDTTPVEDKAISMPFISIKGFSSLTTNRRDSVVPVQSKIQGILSFNINADHSKMLVLKSIKNKRALLASDFKAEYYLELFAEKAKLNEEKGIIVWERQKLQRSVLRNELMDTMGYAMASQHMLQYMLNMQKTGAMPERCTYDIYQKYLKEHLCQNKKNHC